MNKKVSPRSDIPNRDDFYMGMAFWAASKSKDPATQIGAMLIALDNRPLGWGYNGPPKQFSDYHINWDRPDKYDYMDHAEENAIDYAMGHGSLEGATMYVTAKPCKRCMRKMVKNGIKRVVYFPLDKSWDEKSMFNSQETGAKVEEIAKAAIVSVQLVEYSGNLNWMRDRIKQMDCLGVFD